MVVPRTSSRWLVGLIGSTARGVRSTTQTRSWQQIQRRTYAAAEGHGGSHKSSSDLPWAIGSGIVTIPSIIYLLQPNPNSHHGHGHDEGNHEDHGEEHSNEESSAAESEDGEQSSGEEPREGKTQEGGAEEGTSDDGSTTSWSDEQSRPDHTVYDAGQGTPETSGDEDTKEGAYEVESGGNVSGVRFKGATSGGTEEGEQGDTRKHIPDAKGGAKKRIESDYAKSQGVAQDESKDSSKGASNVQAVKQEGLSNTDTKHSTDISNDSDKSKKGEGFVETAKTKGPVDPSRPQK
ncbi:MAG: hypothetical protein L6R41_004012 [Letrouitia leprolyta]|nr:MAG: hypothetical protein L6R41_004012 [Letrouitia leprolyta]